MEEVIIDKTKLKQNTGNRTRICVIVTMFYLVIILKSMFLADPSFWSLELNAQGDFLAGAFAPLAFFWLVLGYYQQGDELRQNTKALLAQEEEMANMVKENARQAAASEQLIEHYREIAEKQELEKLKRSQPIFSISGGGGSMQSREFNFVNGGGKVSNLSIKFTDDRQARIMKHCDINPKHLLPTDYNGKISIMPNKKCSFIIEYTTELNFKSWQKFSYEPGCEPILVDSSFD